MDLLPETSLLEDLKVIMNEVLTTRVSLDGKKKINTSPKKRASSREEKVSRNSSHGSLRGPQSKKSKRTTPKAKLTPQIEPQQEDRKRPARAMKTPSFGNNSNLEEMLVEKKDKDPSMEYFETSSHFNRFVKNTQPQITKEKTR